MSAPTAARADLEARVRAAEADAGAALLALYPRLLLIVFAALNLAVFFFYFAQTEAFSLGSAYVRQQLAPHLVVAYESVSTRRLLPGYMATLPEPKT